MNEQSQIAAQAYGPAGANKTITLRYFASLKDQALRSHEEVKSGAVTALELFDEVRSKYRFPLDSCHMKVAINGAYAQWQDPVSDGDVVVFVPPVSGG